MAGSPSTRTLTQRQHADIASAITTINRQLDVLTESLPADTGHCPAPGDSSDSGRVRAWRLAGLWTQFGLAVALYAVALWGLSTGALLTYLSERGDVAWFGAGAAAVVLLNLLLDSATALWLGLTRHSARHATRRDLGENAATHRVAASALPSSAQPMQLPAGLGRDRAGRTDRADELGGQR